MIYQPFKHIPPYRKGGYDLPLLPEDKNKKDEKNNPNNSKMLAI
ncbi:hypothetical protein [Aggregatibacter actinomycetemcomitans]|nr:hypothetical protein [Aggregatibacter actinomycetemcomitans]